MSVADPNSESSRWVGYAKNAVLIFVALVIFLFALDLMISSFQQLGKTAVETILQATSNPFTALFIGLLVTAIIQSSSATTSMVVALVASGSLSLESAIPIIMGANIGTTITSTIVSLGFIAKKKEFIRAVSAGTYHDFFNILTVAVLFPFEYYYGFLSSLSQQIAISFFNEPLQAATPGFSFFSIGFNPIIQFLIHNIASGFILVILSFALLFGSILFFRKVLTDLLGFDTQHKVQRFFFKSPLKSFGWGLVTTATIRSSTITTSLVVPLVAKKVITLKDAVPFILGANIGTTVTAFIAAGFNSNSAISIAIAHFIINFCGVVIFMITPFVKQVPLWLAIKLGRLTRKYRLVGFLYILLVFFFLPFSLIYFHKGQTEVIEATYEKTVFPTGQKSNYTIVMRKGDRKAESTWMMYEPENGILSQVFSVYRRENVLLIDNEIYEFKQPGFCRDNTNAGKSYQLCVDRIAPQFSTPMAAYDSVFVFKSFPIQHQQQDSTLMVVFISPKESLVLRREWLNHQGTIIELDELVRLDYK